MAEPTESVGPIAGPQQSAEVASTNTPSPASAAAMNNYLGSTIGSLGELKEKAPELYMELMKSLAARIIDHMKRHQERMEKLIKEGQRI